MPCHEERNGKRVIFGHPALAVALEAIVVGLQKVLHVNTSEGEVLKSRAFEGVESDAARAVEYVDVLEEIVSHHTALGFASDPDAVGLVSPDDEIAIDVILR